MRGVFPSGLRALLWLAVAGAGAQAQCLRGGLAVIVNKSNTTESMSVAQLRKVILGDVRSWPDKKPVVLVSRESSSEVFKCVLSAVVRMSDAEYHRYIVSAEFRGGEPLSVRTVNAGPGVGQAVAGSAGSIAVVPASEVPAISGSVRVVRINGKEPGESGYPL